MEILGKEEGFQFGFKRWQGWAAVVNSKCGVPKAREGKAVPLQHTQRLTVTQVVLGTRLQTGGSVSYKLTGSSLCTQRVYKQRLNATLQSNIEVEEEVMRMPARSLNRLKQRRCAAWPPSCRYWRASPAVSSGTHTKSRKGFTSQAIKRSWAGRWSWVQKAGLLLLHSKACAPKTIKAGSIRNNVSQSL